MAAMKQQGVVTGDVPGVTTGCACAVIAQAMIHGMVIVGRMREKFMAITLQAKSRRTPVQIEGPRGSDGYGHR
jgi:hypothetical protein